MSTTTAPALGASPTSAGTDGLEDVPVVRVAGRLDVTTVADVRDVLHGHLRGGARDLVVDLGELDVLDAAGLAMLVATHRLCEQRGGRLTLVEVPVRVWRLLSVTRLTRVLSARRQTRSSSQHR